MIFSAESNSFPSQALIHPGAIIHPGARIEPFAVIHADVEVCEGAVIGAHAVVGPGVRIGRQSQVSPGAYLSGDARQLEYWREESPSAGSVTRVFVGERVFIGPHAVIHGGITIGDHCWIGGGCTLYDGARIGAHCRIFPGAVISAVPQDLKFSGEKTTLEIGEHTTIRECATLNRGTEYAGKTVIGSHVLVMAYAHVAHDCIIGDHVILANAVNMGGHVEIADHAIVGGMSAIHQFVKIGTHAMISGGSLVRKDVPPFVKAGREPLQYEGVNSIGLRRRGFSNEVIHQVQDIYRLLFVSGMNISSALDLIEAQLPAIEERDEIITFVRGASRGIIKGYHGSAAPNDSDLS